MIQIWRVDSCGFFTGCDFIDIEELTELDITKGFTIGYINAKWNGSEWIEGATEEEINEFNLNRDKENTIQPTELELKVEILEKENADLLLDSVKKDMRIEQNELDVADLLLAIGGM